MEAQHALDTNRRPPWAFGLGIDGLDHGHQFRPWHDTVHLVEEPFPASGLAVLFERDLRKCRLLHRVRLLISAALPLAYRERRINQTFLRKIDASVLDHARGFRTPCAERLGKRKKT